MSVVSGRLGRAIWQALQEKDNADGSPRRSFLDALPQPPNEVQDLYGGLAKEFKSKQKWEHQALSRMLGEDGPVPEKDAVCQSSGLRKKS